MEAGERLKKRYEKGGCRVIYLKELEAKGTWWDDWARVRVWREKRPRSSIACTWAADFFVPNLVAIKSLSKWRKEIIGFYFNEEQKNRPRSKSKAVEDPFIKRRLRHGSGIAWWIAFIGCWIACIRLIGAFGRTASDFVGAAVYQVGRIKSRLWEWVGSKNRI